MVYWTQPVAMGQMPFPLWLIGLFIPQHAVYLLPVMCLFQSVALPHMSLFKLFSLSQIYPLYSTIKSHPHLPEVFSHLPANRTITLHMLLHQLLKTIW